MDTFKGIAMVTVHDVKSCFFWQDLSNRIILNQAFPELFSFVKNPDISGFLACNSNPLHDQFHLPLPPEAYAQYLDLELLIQNLQIQDVKDTWSYIWGSLDFSSKKAYRHLIGHRQIHPSFHWLWKSSYQNKGNSFFG